MNKLFSTMMGLLLITNHAMASGSGPYDSTDRYASERSHMTLYIDVGTGCHYIRAGSSSLVPRMYRPVASIKAPSFHYCKGSSGEDSMLKTQELIRDELLN